MRLGKVPLRCAVTAELTWASAVGSPVAETNHLLARVGRLQHDVFLVAVGGTGVEALGGDLFEVTCRDQHVEPSGDTAADLVGAIRAGHRDRHNLALLQQHDVGVDDGFAQ